MNQAVPILIVGPSGVGKNAIIDRLVDQFPQLEKFKTTTSRPKRFPDENLYHFVAQQEFEMMIKNQAFLEWTQIHGFYYGTEKGRVEKIISAGRYPIAAIDVVGVKNYQKSFPNLLTIFVRYESLSELPARLRKARPTMSEAEIARRLQTAQVEMKSLRSYRYVVTNQEGRLDETIKQIASIIEQKI